MVPAGSSARARAREGQPRCPTTPAAAAERNKAIVRALYEAYNRRDYEAAFAHKAKDYTIEVTGTSWVSGRFQGRDYVRHELLPRVFPEGVTFRLRNLVAEGDVVMAEWENEAHRGGSVYRGRAVEVFEFEGDMIKRVRAYVDPAPQAAFFGETPPASG